MEPKPGWQTTEFWLSLFAMLIGAVMASGILDDLGPDNWLTKVIGIVASVLGALGYTVTRAMTKGATAKAVAIESAAKLGLAKKDPQ